MNFQSYSQAGQDQFAHAVIGDGPGTFLDIGMNHPIDKNNTIGLERIGWRGLLIEMDDYCCDTLFPKSGRTSPLVKGDATKIDYAAELERHGLPTHIDYLSLDVDAASLDVLRSIPLDRVSFGVITIEHDAYRNGDKLREPMRQILIASGYMLIAIDVCDQGQRFEDWAVAPRYWQQARRFASASLDWRDVLAQGK